VSKLGLVKWFGEDICKLVLGINVVQINITCIIVVTQEVKADFYVLCFLVEDWVFGYAYGTGAITKQKHSPKF
jgi:hypothetical protein